MMQAATASRAALEAISLVQAPQGSHVFQRDDKKRKVEW